MLKPITLKEVEENLITNENQFHRTFNNMLEGVQIHDFDWRYIYVNDALVKYSKYSAEELIGYTIMEKYPGIEQTNLFKVMQQCMNERVAEHLETEFIFPDGTIGHFDLSIQPIPEGIFILSIDRSDQKKATDKLLKVNRLIAFTSAINQSIVHINNEHELLNNACNIAVDIGQFKSARIDMLDELSGELSLVSIKGANLTIENENHALQGTLLAKVLSTGKYAVSNDVENDPALNRWKKELLQNDINACISLPIKKSGKVIGILGFYSSVKNFFDEEEIILLKEATDDISYALDVLEKAKALTLAEDLAVQNEMRFRALIEKSTDMKTLSTQEGKLKYCSPSLSKVLGFSLEELIHSPVINFIHPNDIPGFMAKRKEIVQTPGKSIYFELQLLHKNGNGIWCEGTVTNMLNEPGVHAMVANFVDISEKKLVEQQQQFDKNNLYALINNTPDLMWSVDKDFNLITSNQPFDEIAKLMSGKVIKKGSNILTDGFSSKQLTRYKKAYERAFAGEAFTEIEHDDDPVDFWTETSYYPIRKGNETIGTACHSRDITERKKAEENLGQSEKRLNEAQAIAHLGNWVLNFATGEALWSEEACRIYGIPLEENNNHTFLSWLSFIHPEDLDNVMTATNESRKTLSGTNLNHRIILKNGTIKNIHSESKFELDQNGNPIGLYGIAYDVTEKRIVEENLKQSESSLKEAQAIAHVGNWAIDIVKNSQIWSDEMCKILGVSKDEVTPTTELFLSFIHPDDFDYIKGKVQEAFKTFENSSFDFRLIRKDGAVRHGYAEWKFKFDKSLNPIGLFGIIQDVTERKLAETERIKIVNDLVLRNKDLEQFAYIISHNLRAPVANILGTTSTLNEPGLSMEEKDILSKGLNESVTKLDNVVKDLSDILQVKRKIDETKEKVCFSKLVDDIKISIKNLIEDEGIVIKYDFSQIDEFLTLKSYLYSIFYNLISNSIKYRQQQIPTIIEIRSHLINDKIAFVFTDNGMGIDLKKRGDQVFGLYKRFHTNIEGKGMGLFMVKTQVETLGGKISIKSEVNKGTEFQIEFDK